MNNVAALEEKRIFLVASNSKQRSDLFTYVIQKHIASAKIFYSLDGVDCLFRISNQVPNILIIDSDLPKKDAFEVTSEILKNRKLKEIAVIIVSPLPDKDQFVDEVVTGRVQFLVEHKNDYKFNMSITRALNWIAKGDNNEYHLRFLVPR